MKHSDGQHYKYVWDAWGRLRKVLKRSNDALVAEYRYNGLGFRISEHYDTDTDGDVDGDDATYHFVYDDSWRIVATYYDDDDAASPKEIFVHHNAGDSGYGTSSYIDAVILRDFDADVDWEDPLDPELTDLEVRHYYCQNWRADVSVIIDDSAVIIERAMYSPYGVPFGIPAGDFVTSATFAEPADGTVDGVDSGYLLGAWGAGWDIADLDNDGDVDGADQTIMNNNWGATLGWGALSLNHNRLGYAGYVFDEALAGTKWHVRYRVLESVLGRWLRRDPAGYIEATNLYEYTVSNPIILVDPVGLSALIDCVDECGIHYPPASPEFFACLLGCKFADDNKRNVSACIKACRCYPNEYRLVRTKRKRGGLPCIGCSPYIEECRVVYDDNRRNACYHGCRKYKQPPPPPRTYDNPYGNSWACQYVWDVCDNGEGWGTFCPSCCVYARECGIFSTAWDCKLKKCGEQFGWGGYGVNDPNFNRPSIWCTPQP